MPENCCPHRQEFLVDISSNPGFFLCETCTPHPIATLPDKNFIYFRDPEARGDWLSTLHVHNHNHIPPQGNGRPHTIFPCLPRERAFGASDTEPVFHIALSLLLPQSMWRQSPLVQNPRTRTADGSSWEWSKLNSFGLEPRNCF